MALKWLNQSRPGWNPKFDSQRTNVTNSEFRLLTQSTAVGITVTSKRESVVANSGVA